MVDAIDPAEDSAEPRYLATERDSELDNVDLLNRHLLPKKASGRWNVQLEGKALERGCDMNDPRPVWTLQRDGRERPVRPLEPRREVDGEGEREEGCSEPGGDRWADQTGSSAESNSSGSGQQYPGGEQVPVGEEIKAYGRETEWKH